MLFSLSASASTSTPMSLLPRSKLLPSTLHSLSLTPEFSRSFTLRLPATPLRILCAAKRTGKQRYPSEKKKLRLKRKEALKGVGNKFEGFWRLSKLAVPVSKDPGKDFLGVSDGLLEEIAMVLEFPVRNLSFLLSAGWLMHVQYDYCRLLVALINSEISFISPFSHLAF